MVLMTVKDLEIVDQTLREAGYDYQLELDNGELKVMGPSDITSSEVGSRLITFLGNWVYPRSLGRIFDSSGGFIMPNNSLKAPDVSFVRAEKLKKTVRYFANLVPDLVVEIKSQSDSIKKLENKIYSFLSDGVEVGILINPDLKSVIIYRANQIPIILTDNDVLTIPELFEGWQLPITAIWPPEF
jgi:Uma2 family endonuclease